MRKKLVRKVAEIGSVPLYLAAVTLSGVRRDFASVVDEVVATPALFCGVIFSNGLCLVFLHTAISSLRG
jgi:hypothetical protein